MSARSLPVKPRRPSGSPGARAGLGAGSGGAYEKGMGSAAVIETLLKATAGGDRIAFRKLYGETSGRLFAVALRILRDRQLAEDAVQEAFVRIWRSAGKYDPARGSPLAWMAVIARNAALDRIKQRADWEPIEELEIPAIEAEPADARVGHCLKKLSEQHRNALVLMYVYGLTHPELAERLNAPLGTVKSWVRRGAAALRECMES